MFAVGSRLIMIVLPGSQYEDICSMAGPLKPRCVSKVLSLNFLPAVLTLLKNEVPDKGVKYPASSGDRANGTRAGFGAMTGIVNCLAIL